MNNNNAFILMPFSEPLNEVYEFLIKGALTEAGYKVSRADDIKSQSNILEDIITGIIQSSLIVADLTDSNANVYYELGIAHALQKKVVLITQDIEELPFDLRSYRVIAYSTHFSKMNEAKNTLKDLAKEALDGTLPFGNPVKDYGSVLQTNTSLSVIEPYQVSEDLGFLDHIVEVEENFESLTEIVLLVGSKLENDFTPKITASTNTLSIAKDLTAKQRRNIVKELATHVDDYANFLKPKNDEYRDLIKNLETSIEFVLTSKNEHDDESISGIESFLNNFAALEVGAQTGRDGFLSMLEVMQNLPSLEKSFNRASKYMQGEIQTFIGNIDQTISMSSRARTLGYSLLSKLQNKTLLVES
ncbi:nucleoside 2-deoxyribosyltransferase [Shewanella holmiensis]|uniref:Nucleoside 2-deoxyribosyltransferase n=1 Tax=Shewanella holmiensis TaxID=2952222 RepID=A0A9X3AUH4_9GAMM|nr:nucleoside 2-deoxyribosyltransferase [Shewanella holmiensis]MCT7941555.1 nucleoside 2-deoxyribosyltransferase [Shewanella holmiensis]